MKQAQQMIIKLKYYSFLQVVRYNQVKLVIILGASVKQQMYRLCWSQRDFIDQNISLDNTLGAQDDSLSKYEFPFFINNVWKKEKPHTPTLAI